MSYENATAPKCRKQYKEQKEADVDDDDDDGGGATLGVKVRSLGSKQLSSAGLSKLTGISATSVMRRVTGHRARQNSIDRLLHIPPGTTLGLAVLKNPTELPMIEAAWESRRAQGTKMMQLLERIAPGRAFEKHLVSSNHPLAVGKIVRPRQILKYRKTRFCARFILLALQLRCDDTISLPKVFVRDAEGVARLANFDRFE